MSAAALLAKNAQPTDAQINEALEGNLCRCGTYLRIREAIHRAALPASGAKGAPAAGKSNGLGTRNE